MWKTWKDSFHREIMYIYWWNYNQLQYNIFSVHSRSWMFVAIMRWRLPNVLHYGIYCQIFIIFLYRSTRCCLYECWVANYPFIFFTFDLFRAANSMGNRNNLLYLLRTDQVAVSTASNHSSTFNIICRCSA